MKKVISFILVLAMLIGMMPMTAFAAEEANATSVQNPFEGKTVSILGHSMSTYAGVSNNTKANSTLGNNDVYYTEGKLGVYQKDTWWQQAIDALGMRLLVNNSWSGSCVFMPRKGEASVGYGDRAVNLHNDHTGEEPDIIWVYIGCNDFAYYKDTFGKAADVDYSALISDNGDGTFTYAAPQTACEAYAIMLHKIETRYPDADIYCITSTARRDPDYAADNRPDTGQPTEYMAELHKVAVHFSCPVIDLEDCIPKEAELFDQYIGDKRAHCNALGMDKITEAVLSVMLGKEARICHVTSQDGIIAEQAVLLGGSYYTDIEVQEGYSVVVTMGGEDIAEEVYSDGKIFIEKVTGDIAVYAMRGPLEFSWQLQNDALVSVGDTENALTKLAGSVADGMLNDARYKLSTDVVLKHDMPWELEWRCAGEWRGCVFTTDEIQNTQGMYYLSRTVGGQLSFGTWTGKQYDNYGVDLSTLDDQVHTYRLVNRISPDGSNMVWVYVDGTEIGQMRNYYIGSKDQAKTSNWICGKDFVFSYIGMDGHALKNCRLDYLKVQECSHTYENGICTACGAEDPNAVTESLSLRYDDHYDVTGKTVEIIDAGTPTSYKVGYGVAEGVLDDAVVTLEGNYLIATGIGTAQVCIDSILYNITVEAAPISLLLLIGQSNMQGIDGNASESIVCPVGQVYATYSDRYKKTVEDVTKFAPSALAGAYCTINVTGDTACLENYPVNMLTAAGDGREGMDSGIAYEWVNQTGEKVWTVNVAYGGSSITEWQKGGIHYEACMELFSACQQTLRQEIAAGHFTMSHMGYFWCQGCADENQTAEWYVNQFLTMHDTLKTNMAFDENTTFEFAGIIPIRSGHNWVSSYRAGVYKDTTNEPYYQSFKDLQFNGPRVAQYWMGNNPELADIWNVCTIQESWATLPDGSDGVASYFQSVYENGIVDYTTQVMQTANWYKPTTPAAVHDNIHYNQIGYNELGRESARNALILLGEISAPDVTPSIKFLTWDGFTPAEKIVASTSGASGTLVVPMVYPVWKSKNETYIVSEGLRYEYYDLLAESVRTEGVLTTADLAATITVTPRELSSFRWNLDGNGLTNEIGDTWSENTLSKMAGSVTNAVFNGVRYQMGNAVQLLHNETWCVEIQIENWTATSGSMILSSSPSAAESAPYFYFRPSDFFVGIGCYNGATYDNYGISLKQHGISCAEGVHTYRFINRTSDDGTNMIYLVVDSQQIGALTDHYINSTLTDSGNNWLNGKDFAMPYLGTTTAPISNCTINYIAVTETNSDPDMHFHNWSDWEKVTAPSCGGPGEEKRICSSCGETQTREVEGVWQTHDLSEHIVSLPQNICAATNLWTVLPHDAEYYHSGEKWAKHESGTVYSVTIAVNAGDKIFATSFGKYTENGNTIGTSNGIRVTFFDSFGVLKTMAPQDTYAEFIANGGYIVAPEGVVAINIPMYGNNDSHEIYILNRDHIYENGTCTGCGENAPSESLSLRYDDRYDITSKTVEIVDAGTPTSFKVGYGVAEGTPDDAVITLDGNQLIATGIGRAQVKIDGVLYEVTVEAAPISLLLILGQSNAEGMEGNANQSIVCPDGQVYSTYAKANGLTGDAGLTVENAGNYIPSALTGPYSTVNINGTDTKLSAYPVNSLTEAGAGKYGMDSGLAYEWVRQTDEKVWVINAAHGASSITSWQKGAENYDQAVALFTACQKVLQMEIGAGHYTFSHMGYYWNQGCADETRSAQWYAERYIAMHENLKQDLACDMDNDTTTADNALEFGNIVLVQAGHSTATGYRKGTYTDTSDSFFMTYKELELRGPRVAQIWMANNPELPDIHIVCTLAQDWVTMLDGSDGVAEYFHAAYKNGIVDYTTQVKQSDSWYAPTTPAAVKDSIHYNQIGYNEIGRESARNTLYILDILEKPQVETTVTFLDWTGYQQAGSIKTSAVGTSDTLVVPLVYPCYESKTVSYTLSGGLDWTYYDLLDTETDGGTLTASVGTQTVKVIGREFYNYRFELVDDVLVSVSDINFRENLLTATASGTYTLSDSILLKHDNPWVVEFNSVEADRFMALSSTSRASDGMFYFFKSKSGSGVLALGGYKDGLYQNYGLKQSSVAIDWTQPHVYQFRNVINDDGSNTIHIFIDNKWVGTATNLIINDVLQSTDNMYLSGKDLTFTSIGCNGFALSTNQMTYLQVYEEGLIPLSLCYDDRHDITGKTVEIVDAGTPTSYKVGYGVAEGTFDDAVITLDGDKLIATGIGTAQVKIDGVLYEVTVEAAPISLLLLIGQSNMRGSEGNADQSIVCPDGMVYATYGDDRGADNTAMTVNNATMFVPSALTGEYSGINVEGTTDCLSGYPVYSLTEAGAGKIGPDSGFAYEWVKQTGEKVWIVNAAHGGTSINVWQPGTTEYEQCQALFTACQETLRKEIAAGHFTLSHMGYFWCQGCSDRTQSAAWYVEKYLAMHEGFKTELAFDHDSNPETADKTFEFGGIIPVRVGSTATCYRDGAYTVSNPYAYHESFVDLRFNGPRVAQYWMINNPELTDIWGVCNIGEDWVWMPDGTNGVTEYFQTHYPNGRVDYTTQVTQKESWYTPTTPKAVHDSIHYNQIGYNEIGRESVRNALILLGELEAPDVETTVELLTWDGYTEATQVPASTTGNSATLVVPVVYPIWKSKDVTYELSEGLSWNYYDLLADTVETEGVLTTIGAQSSVNVTKPDPGSHFAGHLSQLPEKVCCGLNLWSVLEHDEYYYASGTHWGIYSSGEVPSVTISVNPGDRIFATSFGKAGENGHATSSGIRVTFFSAYGVAKTMTPAETYAEFSANGGYLIAPEGAVAINIAMWDNSDTNEIYILNAPHNYDAVVTAPTCTEGGYTTHTCTGCGASYTSDHTKALGHSYAGNICIRCGRVDPNAPECPEDSIAALWPLLNTDLTHIVCYGQSFSVGADAPIFPDPVVDGVYVFGSITDSSQGNSLSPLASTGNQHPIISAGNVLARLLAQAGYDTDIILGSYGSGGRTIAQLMSEERQAQIKHEEGYTYDCLSSGRYTVFENSVNAIAQYAATNGQSVSCPVIVYLQGETDQNTDAQLGYPENPSRAGYGAGGDKEKYKEYMMRLKEDMQRQVMEVYGQTEKPLFIIYQVSGTYTRTEYSSINMAQIEFAQENADVILVQTPYFAPHYTVSHHLTTNGYRWLGEYVGRYIYTALVEREKPWPMLPESFTIEEGNVVRIAVAGAQNGLSIDTYTVENATNSGNLYGFNLVVDGTIIVPASVTVSGNDILLIMPEGIDLRGADSVYVYYAGKSAKGTGNIRDNCADQGFYEYLDDSNDTGTGNNQGISHSALDANGNSLIGKKYPLYNWLASFCYELPVERKQSAFYHWELSGTDLVSVTGASQNDLTLLQGSIENGVLMNVQYQMSETVVLYHDYPWAIEWKAAGNGSNFGGGMLLAAADGSGSKAGALYLPADSRGFVAWNVSSESRNYGIKLADFGIDTRQEHIYRIENRIAADGTNTLYLIVDGIEIGDMNTAYSTKDGSKTEETTSWINGHNIYLSFMGKPTNFLLKNMKLTYLKIWENTCNHSYSATVTAPTCTEGGYTTYTCTTCGDSYVADETEAIGHAYSSVVAEPTCTEQGYTTHTCTTCGASYTSDHTDALGHSYSGTTCVRCGAVHPEAGDYKDKVISILSASTSTFAGYIPTADGFNLEHRARYPQDNLLTDVNDTWWMQLINELDAQLGINDSWAGSQVLNTQDTNSGDLGPDACMASLTRIQNLGANGTPDLILFFGAGNDMGRGVPLGSFDPATAPTEVDLTATKWETLADAYVAAIMRLQYFYPDAEIVVMTTYAMPSYVTNAKLDKYGPVLKAICDHYGVKTVDLRNSGVTFDMLPDKIHPNAEGMDHITDYVLQSLLKEVEMEAGEHTVHSVTHNLTNANTSLHYYKGVSHDKPFVETVSGLDVTVTVTMGGVDITATAYADGVISIPSVTGDLVITVKGRFDADGHLQQLPENLCAGTNLWTALEPENIYYTASGWGNTAAGTSWSITFPVKPGDRIWATSLGAYPGNGSTANGVRVTWFDENGVLATLDRNTVYAEFAKNGYITAPEGAVALNLPMTNNVDGYAVYVLSAEHHYDAAVTAPTCTEKGYTTHTCTLCGDSYVDSYVDAMGHSFGEWHVVTEATCTAEGQKRRDCSNCDHYETEAINATGHSYDSKVTAPTCTERGYTTHTCATCGDSYVDSYVDATGHDWNEGVVTLEPTEETEGQRLYTCKSCGTTRTEVIPTIDHVHNYNAVVTAPTCTERGYTTHTCRCGDSYVDSYVDATGHSYGEWYVVTEATCTAEGQKRRDCANCDYYETEAINATGHSYDSKVTAPTCTEQGYTTHTCANCGDSYVDGYVDATGHSYGEWYVVTEATCTVEGLKQRDCSNCDHYETEVIDATGHSYESEVTAPTCTERGSTTHTCSTCSDSYVDSYVDAMGHSYGEWYVVTEATCTVEGLKQRDCSNCDHYETEVIDATGHSYESEVTAPTCTEKGYTTHTCANCGDSYVDSYVDATGHSYGEWYVVTEATCTAEGQKRHDCANCDHYEIEVINATGHSYESEVTAPTCTEQGYTTHTCSACSDSYVDSYVDATGHTANGEATCTSAKICVVCGAVLEEMLEHKDADSDHNCDGCGLVLSVCASEDNDNLCDCCGAKLWEYGDANGDNTVNGKDLLMLRRYMANYDFTTGESTIEVSPGADANGDGVVNGKDLLLLRRYMANYDFTTGESSIELGPQAVRPLPEEQMQNKTCGQGSITLRDPQKEADIFGCPFSFWWEDCIFINHMV